MIYIPRLISAAAALFTAGALVTMAHAQTAQDREHCADLRGKRFAAELRVGSCTAVIASGSVTGRELAEAYSWRGIAHLDKGDSDRAMADYNEALRIDPRYANAYSNRGNIYIDKGDADRALADYNKAIELDPSLAFAHNNRGHAYRYKGDVDRALIDYNKAIELDPNFSKAYNNRANAYADKGDIGLALADYTKAIELDPKNGDFVRDLALAKFYSGDFKGAAGDLLHALEMGDDAYLMLYRYLARTRNGETAGEELQANVGRLKTKDWPYAVTELYLDRRSPAATLDAATKPDERCEAQFYIGEWHVAKGNAAEAAAALKAAVDTCPKTFIEYTGAIAELKRLKR